MSAPWRCLRTCEWRWSATACRWSMRGLPTASPARRPRRGPPARVARRAAEPRPGLGSGHMPRSFNVPYARVVENGQLVSRARIEAAFTDAGVDLDQPGITSCGSGVTAAILTFALESIGREPKGLYDGSWAEWGSRPDLPVEREKS